MSPLKAVNQQTAKIFKTRRRAAHNQNGSATASDCSPRCKMTTQVSKSVKFFWNEWKMKRIDSACVCVCVRMCVSV